jgi:hypothetical protein
VYGTAQQLRNDGEERTLEGVREAVRYGAGVLAAAAIFLVLAVVWVSTCSGSTTDTVACGTSQRTLLGIGAALILFAGGLWAVVRAHRAWHRDGASWPWHGAAWFLLLVAVVVADVGLRVTALG